MSVSGCRLFYNLSVNSVLRDVCYVLRRCMPPPRDPSPRLAYWDVLRHVVHPNLAVRVRDPTAGMGHLCLHVCHR